VRLSLYADDATLFVSPTNEDVSTVVDIMARFGDATGLCLNMTKSAVLPIRCDQIDIEEVLQCFIGLTITLGHLRMVHLQPCLDRAAGKLAGWQ
jgi:hypothetical protein